MTKEYFTLLADFNIWANNIVCNWLEQLNEEQWSKEIVSSFSSVRETVLHIISAEKAWLERFEQKPVEWIQFSYKGSKEEHIELWKKTSQKLRDYVAGFDESRLQTSLTYKRLNGEEKTTPFFVMFAHTFNHSTYHRGQLVTMIRQTGFTNIGSTDLLSFYRK
ncbi:MAG: DinB family protein [Chitinophagaceae bacterium]|nr:DinB family protein [Chitinophagaceae bacterium]